MLLNENELGFWGFSWQEKVRNNAKKFLTNDQYKQFTVETVKNLHGRYIKLMSQGKKPVSFIDHGNIVLNRYSMDTINLLNILKNEMKINIVFVNAFLRSLYDLAVQGVIKYSYLDPVSIQQDIDAGNVLKPDFFNKMFKPIMSNLFIVGGGILAGMYLLNAKGNEKHGS